MPTVKTVRGEAKVTVSKPELQKLRNAQDVLGDLSKYALDADATAAKEAIGKVLAKYAAKE